MWSNCEIRAQRGYQDFMLENVQNLTGQGPDHPELTGSALSLGVGQVGLQKSHCI